MKNNDMWYPPGSCHDVCIALHEYKHRTASKNKDGREDSWEEISRDIILSEGAWNPANAGRHPLLHFCCGIHPHRGDNKPCSMKEYRKVVKFLESKGLLKIEQDDSLDTLLQRKEDAVSAKIKRLYVQIKQLVEERESIQKVRKFV